MLESIGAAIIIVGYAIASVASVWFLWFILDHLGRWIFDD